MVGDAPQACRFKGCFPGRPAIGGTGRLHERVVIDPEEVLNNRRYARAAGGDVGKVVDLFGAPDQHRRPAPLAGV